MEVIWRRRFAEDTNTCGAIQINLPHQVFGSDDACGDCVSKSVQLDLLVALEVLLAQKDIEVGGLLHRDVNLVGVLSSASSLGGCLIDAFYHA